MWPGALLTLLLCSSLEAQENSFTINNINMVILPDQEVQNGENMTLQCNVDISTTSHVRPQHRVLFYKDDVLFRNVSSTEMTESYIIPQARVYDSGTYKCTVVLNNKVKTTPEYEVLVRGVPPPRVVLDKKEVIEGGVVMINCSVPEEKGPVHFTIEKVNLETREVKSKRKKSSPNQNSVTLAFTVEEQERVIYFQCKASIISLRHMETSENTKSDMVTVRESFSSPKFYVYPEGPILEGTPMHINCTIQVAHMATVFPEIIIQKDKAIVAHSRQGNVATYSAMATVEHNGNYTCKVETSQISKVSSIVVNITELFSKPKLESSATRLDQGDSLHLWCATSGATADNFTIQKGEMIVSQSSSFGKRASVWDSGIYTCVAGIGKVFKKSNTVRITVCEMLSKPRIFYDSKSEVIKGQTVEVNCQSINGTSPISYHLLKASDTLESRTVNSNEPAVFRDNPTEDAEYQCKANNCHSNSEMTSELLLVKVIAPVAEVKLSILNKMVESGEEIVLRCSVNKASGPITYKFYKEKEVRPFHEVTLNDTQAIWFTTQASVKQEGQYYCTASNRANLAPNILKSNILTVKVFLAPWKKGLIAVVVIVVIIALLVLGARCYFRKKAKAKQMPVEMSRPAVPLLTSNNEKVLSDSSPEANRPYGYNDDIGNHATKPINENKEPLTLDVEYTEVEVNSLEPQEGLGRKGTETVYSEIRKANPGRQQPWSPAPPDPQSHSRQNLNSNKFPDVSDADNI